MAESAAIIVMIFFMAGLQMTFSSEPTRDLSACGSAEPGWQLLFIKRLGFLNSPSPVDGRRIAKLGATAPSAAWMRAACLSQTRATLTQLRLGGKAAKAAYPSPVNGRGLDRHACQWPSRP